MKLRSISPQFLKEEPGAYYMFRLDAHSQTRINVGEYKRSGPHPLFDLEMVDVTHEGSVTFESAELGSSDKDQYVLVYKVENRNDSFAVVALRRKTRY
jgi:hypothetical protein